MVELKNPDFAAEQGKPDFRFIFSERSEGSQNARPTDQSRFLDDSRLKAERGAAGLGKSTSCQFGCPFHLAKGVVASRFNHLLSCTQPHRDPCEKLGERIMNLAPRSDFTRKESELSTNSIPIAEARTSRDRVDVSVRRRL